MENNNKLAYRIIASRSELADKKTTFFSAFLAESVAYGFNSILWHRGGCDGGLRLFGVLVGLFVCLFVCLFVFTPFLPTPWLPINKFWLKKLKNR